MRRLVILCVSAVILVGCGASTRELLDRADSLAGTEIAARTIGLIYLKKNRGEEGDVNVHSKGDSRYFSYLLSDATKAYTDLSGDWYDDFYKDAFGCFTGTNIIPTGTPNRGSSSNAVESLLKAANC